jgi:cell division protein ZipA
MNELRWILFAAGLLLIAAIYAWGVRARRRAAAPGHERTVRVEPARTVPVVPEPEDSEPVTKHDEPPFEVDAPQGDAYEEFESPPRPASGSLRREPRLEPGFDESFLDEPPTVRLEPRLEPRLEARPEPPAPAPEPPPRKPASQKIVAVRVVAATGAQFAGEQLLDVLAADGFTFGRYQIFHRLDEGGRPMVSLASLKEPGTFDPAAMPGTSFRGVALFAVMPGPLPGLRAFDELIVTARALAATLGGQLQDERGGPLTLARIGQLREDVAEFERARGADPDR